MSVSAPNTEALGKDVRRELAMIRSSRDAGCDIEAVEYERNLADRFVALAARLSAAEDALASVADETLPNILDVTTGWTGPMSPEQRLVLIEMYATEGLKLARAALVVSSGGDNE